MCSELHVMVRPEDLRGFGYRTRELKSVLMFTYSLYLYDVVDWLSHDVILAINIGGRQKGAFRAQDDRSIITVGTDDIFWVRSVSGTYHTEKAVWEFVAVYAPRGIELFAEAIYVSVLAPFHSQSLKAQHATSELGRIAYYIRVIVSIVESIHISMPRKA